GGGGASWGGGGGGKPDRRGGAPDTAVVTSTRRLLASSTNRIFMLTTIRRWRIRFAALPIEGVFRRHTEGGARRGVPRPRLVTAAREVRETARQALRPGREELAACSSGGNAGNRSASLPKNATVGRREVPGPSPRDARLLARAWPAPPDAWRRAWFCVEDARERASDAAGRTGARNTRAALGAPLPSVRGTDPRSKLGRLAPRERVGLFDIVRTTLLSSPRN